MTEPTTPNPDPALPPRDGDAPLHELTRDQLSAFLLASFVGDELLDLCRKAKVRTSGGYRLESLSEVEHADLLADEIRYEPKARAGTIELLRKLYEFPALENVVLPRAVAEEVSALAVESDAPVRMLWRLIADPSKEIREAAAVGLEVLADELLGKPKPEAAANAQPDADADVDDAPKKPQTDAALRKQAERAGAQAARAREKTAELKAQLKAARTQLTQVERDAASRAREAQRLTQELAKTRDKLNQAKQKTGADAREKLEKERDELAARVATLEEKARALTDERKALAEKLEATQKHADAPRPAAPEPARPESEDDALAELPQTWLFPRFTREFYDSLEKWDVRIQRAAFKQAFLLAENHRHPSLRAIPLLGLEGYYRVRIATDVRLIYRRSDDEREVELLSLIDREDLDRYVRQAKTR